MSILDVGLSSLLTMFLPISIDLPNILFTIMVFHRALLLTRKLISQLVKCIHRLLLIEVAGLTMFSIILKQQTSKMGG